VTARRAAAVAGLFYPADAAELRRTVTALLDAALSPGEPHVPKVLVVPHAGYVYSGPVAATAYARVIPGRGRVRRVVLLGPAHRALLRGLATHSARAFETPLGAVATEPPPLDAEIPVHDAAHLGEHSLEVHLPFLQVALGDFRVVPILVGDAAPDDVARALDALWGGPETLIVVSSDLSHFLDCDTARRRDRATADAIVRLDAGAVRDDDACGARPLRGLLVALQRRDLALECIDLRNSSDTAGPDDRVVGYGAFAAYEPGRSDGARAP
jgi:AmmeMemoRadiSam system protein B